MERLSLEEHHNGETHDHLQKKVTISETVTTYEDVTAEMADVDSPALEHQITNKHDEEEEKGEVQKTTAGTKKNKKKGSTSAAAKSGKDGYNLRSRIKEFQNNQNKQSKQNFTSKFEFFRKIKSWSGI